MSVNARYYPRPNNQHGRLCACFYCQDSRRVNGQPQIRLINDWNIPVVARDGSVHHVNRQAERPLVVVLKDGTIRKYAR